MFEMTPRQIFVIVFGALCLVQCCLAIYDPNVESTTKPPKRREFSWFSKVQDEQTTIPSDKLMRPTEWDSDSEEAAQIPLKPTVPNAGATKTRSSWTKTPKKRVQQEKEIIEQSMIPDPNTDRLNIVNALFGGNQNKNGENNNPQNVPSFNARDESFNARGNKFIKKATKSSNRHYDVNVDPDQYEGVNSDTKKPHKEKLHEWKKQKLIVAKLDSEGNPSCPDNDVIGQFVYPRDCKYFVNCWKGRAVIQACAPGTLFNPDTLECDFPHKAKCYGSEFSKYSTVDESSYHSGEGRLRELCAHLTGMIPHPDNCSQFIQCANGAPIVMDCGPGTAFNPTISVCDWPRNVPGCEVPVISDGEEPSRFLTPPKPDYGRSIDYGSKSKYAVKKLVCPQDFTGLLPHPDTCKKFLQCANGATYVMDCGPGTAFNPSLSVCDWPYNVPGCKNDGSSTLESTHPNQNHDSEVSSSRDHTVISQGHDQWHSGNGPSYHPHHHHHHHPTHEPWNSPGRQPEENSELYRPTWRPIPQYDKPSTPKYFDEDSWHQQTHNYGAGKIDVRMGGSESRTSGNRGSSYGSYDEGEQVSQSPYGRSYGSPSNGDSFGSSYGENHPDVSLRAPHLHNHQYQPHHHRPDGADIYNRQPQSRNPHSPPIPSSKLEPPHEYTDHQSAYDTDSQATVNFSKSVDDNYKPYPIESQRIPNHRQIDPYYTEETRRPSQSKGSDRRFYGRIDRDFAILKPDKLTPPVGGNVYVDSTFELSEQKPQVPWDYHSEPGRPRPSNTNPTNWNQPGISSTGAQGPDSRSWVSMSPPRHSEGVPRTKEPVDQDDKFRDWAARTNVHEQSTVDKVSDSKMNQWAHNTDYQAPKGQVGTGSKNTTPSLRPTVYPEGIYVNVNGTKGHYITKDFEIHQGHSQTKTYSHVNPSGPRPSNKTQFTSESQYPIYRGSDPPLHERTKPNITTEAHKATRSYFTTETGIETEYDPNVPSVSIENDNEDTSNFPNKHSPTKNGKKPFKKVVEPDFEEIPEAFEVDILEDKEVWKPRLVFENKTTTDQNKTSDESSVIMKINQRRSGVDVFFTEAAPLRQEEPAFPVHYVPPVRSISHTPKSKLLTPVSGQVVRLRGGSGPRDGYVEVQGIQPGWGVVCDTRNGWTLKEAHIVCRQLGYTRGAEMAWQGRSNGNGMPTWIAANSVTCFGNETRFQSCKFTHGDECRVDRDAIGVRCLPNRVAHCRKDEIPHLGQCYYLAEPDTGLNHAEALEYCTNRQSNLIDITTQAENDFLSEWLSQGYPEVASVMTSGVGVTMMNKTMWLWDDSNRAKFKFTKWWPGWMHDAKQPPWTSSRAACIVMKRKFPCHNRPDSICVADYFFWDIEDCASSNKGHSFVCKRPYDDIGCIYGKGNQYSGNANVTSSGKPCLSWADDSVAHPLYVNVLNPDEREKLKGHNYCRNPNPNKESRPWCFTGPYGEREYCDIPSCGRIESKKLIGTGQCKPKHFECLPGECIPSPWVCDGEEDCTNGADERTCGMHMDHFHKYANQKLEGYDMEKWLNTPLKTCALRCKEADFTCRSFAHKADGNVCLLSESNIGMTGALQPSEDFDYYEMIERSINCDRMFVCNNRKCVNQTQVCDGKNDCNDRSDENVCTIENLGYEIRLAGSESKNEGRIEVKVLGLWGQVCDDGFGMIDADVICKELGFKLGAQEVRPGGFYGNLEPPTRFMVDQLKCRGNETSLRECDFDGWGVHNCQPEEAVGVVCKTAVDNCKSGHWKCDNSPVCIPVSFICDDVTDCPDRSDESPEHCNATFKIRLVNGSSPLEGRVEVRHHGVWGTVCDDDFSNATATVVCRSLGYGGVAVAKKNSFFGGGEGPIWLDQVSCHGNETQLYRCEHNHWGQHNCEHNEDAGVICTVGDVNAQERSLWEPVTNIEEMDVHDLLPADCGKRAEDFDDDEDLIFAKVVHGSIAKKGTYPWQASIRVRGHSRSSHWCGAVVISPLHILTAAHCLEGYNKGAYFVRAGDYNTEITEGTEVEANIEDYYIHEDFRKGHRMNNDIALVLLKGQGIPLGKDIMPICLPSEDTEYPAGMNCTISGFGSIETGKTTQSRDLRYGWIPLLDQSLCRAEYVYGENAISDGMMCAGYLDEGVDTCDGDSGGPLACYNDGVFTLYGLTSWGQHCGKANKPGVYVRIAYYRSWINQKIKESLYGR